jgi:CBS domain-containing protein
MGKRIRDMMTTNPTSIDASTTVKEAAESMRDEDIGMIPVLEDGRLVGTLTDRDIAIRVVAEDLDPETTRAIDIASTHLVTVDPSQDLDEALELMAEHQVRRLPALDEEGHLVGIVAQADVAREAEAERAGQTVEQISR